MQGPKGAQGPWLSNGIGYRLEKERVMAWDNQGHVRNLFMGLNTLFDTASDHLHRGPIQATT